MSDLFTTIIGSPVAKRVGRAPADPPAALRARYAALRGTGARRRWRPLRRRARRPGSTVSASPCSARWTRSPTRLPPATSVDLPSGPASAPSSSTSARPATRRPRRLPRHRRSCPQGARAQRPRRRHRHRPLDAQRGGPRGHPAGPRGSGALDRQGAAPRSDGQSGSRTAVLGGWCALRRRVPPVRTVGLRRRPGHPGRRDDGNEPGRRCAARRQGGGRHRCGSWHRCRDRPRTGPRRRHRRGRRRAGRG